MSIPPPMFPSYVCLWSLFEHEWDGWVAVLKHSLEVVRVEIFFMTGLGREFGEGLFM